MAVRQPACLVALTGAWRHPGRRLLSTSGNPRWMCARSPCPDLYPDARLPPRALNMSFIGVTSTAATCRCGDPPHNANPVAVAPDKSGARRLCARGTSSVWHEQFQTDTADYADILLPATSQLEHRDLPRPTAISTLWTTGRRSRRSARRALQHRGFPCARPPPQLCGCRALRKRRRHRGGGSRADDPRVAGLAEACRRRAGQLRPSGHAPFADGGFLHAFRRSAVLLRFALRTRPRPRWPGIRPPSRCPTTRRWVRAIRSR